ncbi:phosphoribosylamine--glycine ligase [Carnobacterium gallinarum]|uniref:phosphoribosylamine--glycine ligase n=1 Tax=Carnobacterium gallinarum TaxID=2749 RepID=UPI000550D175|nr:phosphoribosylamine--glycine ligase [Carnobacterium gallinarum]
MKLLVIGSGGREHAICKKLLESPLVETVFCAKGNAGMTVDGIQLVDISEDNHPELIAFAKKNQVDWSFIGPEVPLLNGIVDDFEAAGLKAFGPHKKAALIEGSKDFAKELMTKYQIPTAAHKTFTDYDEALAYVTEKGVPIVIKADGLAAGKGVVVAEDMNDATLALKDMLLDEKFGASSSKVVVEEFLAGEEFSLLAFVKNDKVYPMVISQDHKRAYEGDKGPNTGGMGAYTPVPQIPETMVQEAIEKVLRPAALGMIQEGRSFTGILYAGLIATNAGPKVIEFNARFGDPETQVVLKRLKTDLAEIITALLTDQEPSIEWETEGFEIGVVVAAEGYPAEYATGISLPDFSKFKDVTVYTAGVQKQEEELVSTGGRIYLVGASGASLAEAREKIYHNLQKADTDQTFYRMDIGHQGLHQK